MMKQRHNKLRWLLVLAAVSVLAIVSPAAYAFNLEISLSGFTPTQEAVFDQAESYWESIITGYQPGITLGGITIQAQSTAIDGVNGILGSAGPTHGTSQGGYFLAYRGVMNFDSADIAALEVNGTLDDVILHEMAHVIGFGTLWTYNGVYVDGTGQYTGAAGLAAYQAEFEPLATYVPVELGGGPGTMNGHWDENEWVVGSGYNTGPTGITDPYGHDMQSELMTGWLEGNTFVSLTTQNSFVDIGYAVSPVPLPGAIVFFASGLLCFIGYKRRQGST